MKKIKLYNTNKYILVDDSDFIYLNQFRWISRRGYPARHIQNYPQKYKYIHHEILNTNLLIDHIDGNILNNQRLNLRIADKSQNSMNCKIHKHNTTGFKGVSKCGNKYRAYIVKNNKQIHIGCYKTAQEAADAYDKKALEIFKNFARTNKRIYEEN